MSLIKYRDETKHERGELHWGRADLDGAPFLNTSGRAPLLKEQEMEEMTRQVYDVRVAVFNIADEEQKKQYEEIVDKAANQWYQILYTDRQFVADVGSWVVYIEYMIITRQLVTPER